MKSYPDKEGLSEHPQPDRQGLPAANFSVGLHGHVSVAERAHIPHKLFFNLEALLALLVRKEVHDFERGHCGKCQGDEPDEVMEKIKALQLATADARLEELERRNASRSTRAQKEKQRKQT